MFLTCIAVNNTLFLNLRNHTLLTGTLVYSVALQKNNYSHKNCGWFKKHVRVYMQQAQCLFNIGKLYLDSVVMVTQVSFTCTSAKGVFHVLCLLV